MGSATDGLPLVLDVEAIDWEGGDGVMLWLDDDGKTLTLALNREEARRLRRLLRQALKRLGD